jgi:hypothetical protein
LSAIRLSLAVLLALASAGASAQALYRSTMPDGRVVIGDRPMAGARKVEEIRVPEGNVVGSPAPAQKPKAPDAGPPRTKALAEAEAELKQAEKALEQARGDAERGVEPLEGERLGTAGGGSRLGDAYWARQKALADAVQAAQKRLEDALAKYKALR